MADENTTVSVVSDIKQSESVEMEFKVTDIHDEALPGWRHACISDVEKCMEQVQAELCGMTFNVCSLANGTIGGPGLGYQISDTIDNSLDHKLLVTDQSTLTSEVPLSDAKPDDAPVGYNQPILNDECCIEKNEIITQETDNLIQPPLSPSSEYEKQKALQNSEEIQCGGIGSDQDLDNKEVNMELTDNTLEELPQSKEVDNTLEELPQGKEVDSGSGNDSEVSEVTPQDKINKPVSDLESGKSSESSPNTKRKTAKRMSQSMIRLTTKKESPEKRSSDMTSASERKAKADELKKKKISEQRSKDDERRAAVLERRKKLEDAERAKKEALYKKLAPKESEKTGTRPGPMKGKNIPLTSNLTQKKSKPTDLSSTTVPKRTETKTKTSVTERPKSAIVRPSMGFPAQKTKSVSVEDKKTVEVKRPSAAFGSRAPSATKPATKPSPRQPSNIKQPAHPTALGISNVDKKKPTNSRPPAERVPFNTSRKPLPKSKSISSVDVRSKGKDEKQADPSSSSDKKKSTDMAKEKPTKGSIPPKQKKGSTPKENVMKDKASKKELTEEQAEKALAEQHKKTKEEAEEKAQIELEKDEVERLKREEEEKGLAEQLKLEEERQAAQLKKEEEERNQKLLEEKEQSNREEKEHLEKEQQQREEEIERKKKLELDEIQKEQERQEMLLEQERIERKKRVEMIMDRVSSKRTTASDSMEESEDSLTIACTENPSTLPPEITTDPARLEANDILHANGLGRSTEDISMLTEGTDDHGNNNKYEAVPGNFESEDCGNVSLDVVPLDERPSLKEQSVCDIVGSKPPVPSLEEKTSTQNLCVVELNKDDTESAEVTSIQISCELSESIDGLKLDNDIEDVNIVSLLNDTNNNKELIETRSSPINAWGDNVSTSQLESSEKIQNHAQDDVPVFVNGDQDETKGINSSSDLTSTADLECAENSLIMESDQWSQFEDRMKQIQPSCEQAATGEEKLWKVFEGKVELSECY